MSATRSCSGVSAHQLPRQEVVAIFLDVHPSMLEDDLALPTPTRAYVDSDAATAPSPLVELVRDGAGQSDHRPPYTPPTTRYEVVVEAVRAFIAQKERAVAPVGRVSFALYAVLTAKVVELLAPTPGGSAALGEALRDFLGRSGAAKYGEMLSRVLASTPSRRPVPPCVDAGSEHGSTGGGVVEEGAALAYPFAAVEAALTGVARAMGVGGDEAAAAPPPRRTTAGMESDSPSLSEPPALGCCFVQGIALVSRPLSTPLGEPPAHTACVGGDVWLDVVVLTPAAVPSTAGMTSTSTSLSLVPPTAATITLGVPCRVVEPVAFTSIPHPGLALGPTLTRLLATRRRPRHGGCTLAAPGAPPSMRVVELRPNASPVDVAERSGGSAGNDSTPSFLSSGLDAATGEAARAQQRVRARGSVGAAETRADTATACAALPPLRSTRPPQSPLSHHVVTPLLGVRGAGSSATEREAIVKAALLPPAQRAGAQAGAGAGQPLTVEVGEPSTSCPSVTTGRPQGVYVRSTIMPTLGVDEGSAVVARGRPAGAVPEKRRSLTLGPSGSRPGGAVEWTGLGLPLSPSGSPLLSMPRRTPKQPPSLAGRRQALHRRVAGRGEGHAGSTVRTTLPEQVVTLSQEVRLDGSGDRSAGRPSAAPPAPSPSREACAVEAGAERCGDRPLAGKDDESVRARGRLGNGSATVPAAAAVLGARGVRAGSVDSPSPLAGRWGSGAGA